MRKIINMIKGFVPPSFIAAVVALILVGTLNFYIDRFIDQIVTLRTPTIIHSLNLAKHLQDSVASSKGYALTSNIMVKVHRINADKQIDHTMRSLEDMSQNWTIKANKQRLQSIKKIYPQLQETQLQLEEENRGNPAETIANLIALETELSSTIDQMAASQTTLMQEDLRILSILQTVANAAYPALIFSIFIILSLFSEVRLKEELDTIHGAIGAKTKRK